MTRDLPVNNIGAKAKGVIRKRQSRQSQIAKPTPDKL